jgi:hypothetical protein
VEHATNQVPTISRRGEMPNVPGALNTIFGFYVRFVIDASGRIVPAVADAQRPA